MKSAVAAVALAALTVASGCAPTVVGGPPVAPPPGLQDAARVGAVTLSSARTGAGDDFAESFVIEVREELERCLRGATPVDVRVNLVRLDRESPADRLTGEGLHALSGTVEFLDPARDAVLARFPVTVANRADGRFEGVIGDREILASEAFGRAVCEQASGAGG